MYLLGLMMSVDDSHLISKLYNLDSIGVEDSIGMSVDSPSNVALQTGMELLRECCAVQSCSYYNYLPFTHVVPYLALEEGLATGSD